VPARPPPGGHATDPRSEGLRAADARAPRAARRFLLEEAERRKLNAHRALLGNFEDFAQRQGAASPALTGSLASGPAG